MKILILTGSPDSYSIKRLVEEGQKRKHEVFVENPIDLMTFISSTKGHDRGKYKDCLTAILYIHPGVRIALRRSFTSILESGLPYGDPLVGGLKTKALVRYRSPMVFFPLQPFEQAQG